MSKIIREIQPHWTVVRPYLSIGNEEDYDRAVEQMNELIDLAGRFYPVIRRHPRLLIQYP